MKYLVDIIGIGAAFSGNVTVADEAYGGGWSGSTQVPTKNAIYGKIETLPTVNLYTGDGSLAGARTVTMGTNELQWVGTGGTIYINSGRLGVQTPVFGGSRLGDNELQVKNIDTQSILFKNNSQATVGSLFMNPSFDTFTIRNFNGEDNFIEVTANSLDDTNASRSGNLELGLTLNYIDTGLNAIKLFNNDVGTTPGTIGDKMGILLQTDGTFQAEKEFWFGRYNGSTYSPIFTVSTAEVVTFTNDVIVPDEGYGGGWNGSLEVPTKNAVYGKIQALPNVTFGTAGQIPYSSGSNFAYTTGLVWNNGTSTLEVSGLSVSDITPVFSALLVDGDSADNLVAIDPTTGILKELTQATLGIPDNTDYVDLTNSQTITGQKTFQGATEGVAVTVFENTTTDAQTQIQIKTVNPGGSPIGLWFGGYADGTANMFSWGRSSNLETSYAMRLNRDTGDLQLYGDLIMDGSTSGTITIVAPAAAGSNTITWPAATGTVALTSNIPTNSQYVDLTTAQAINAGAKKTFQSSATTAGIALGGVTTDPSTLSNGDIWFRSGVGELKYRENATTRTVATLTKAQTFTNKTINLGSNTISGTKAQFDTAVTDDNFFYASGGTLTGALTVQGNSIDIQGASPRVQLTESGVDNWYLLADAGVFSIRQTTTSTQRFSVDTDGTLRAGSTASGNTIWHAGNDGSGSGLDADLFKGRGFGSSANWWDKMTYIDASGQMATGRYIHFYNNSTDTAPSGIIDNPSDAYLRFQQGSGTEAVIEAFQATNYYARLGANSSGGYINLGNGAGAATILRAYGDSDFYGGNIVAHNGGLTAGTDLNVTGITYVGNGGANSAPLRLNGTGTLAGLTGQVYVLGRDSAGTSMWYLGVSSATNNDIVLYNYDGGGYLRLLDAGDGLTYNNGTSNTAYWDGAGSPTFTGPTAQMATYNFNDSSDRPGLLQISGVDTTKAWYGIQIKDDGGQLYSIMSNSNTVGIYDDTNNKWVLSSVANTYTRLYYNGSTKLDTTNTGITVTGTGVATDWALSSDQNLKDDIKPLGNYKITTNWAQWNWKDGSGHDIGLIAQDLEKTNPEFVVENEEGEKAVKYTKVLVAKMAEKDAQIAKLQAENDEFRHRLDRLELILEKLL